MVKNQLKTFKNPVQVIYWVSLSKVYYNTMALEATCRW